ncbi:MAG: nonstructural protein [Microviridae sp.]|nr:MAG: nonstructural protein [Microviridae sp.]
MVKVLCSVYDSKARVFSAPFCSPHIDVAIRDFTRAVNDPATDLYKFPADYTLVHIGQFDDLTASVEINHPIVTIGLGSNYKE